MLILTQPFKVLLCLCMLSFGANSIGAYPDRPIRLIVPSGAGGITDNLARLLVTQLSPLLGQQVFVENKPGASGISGTQFVANAPADGYTLLMVFPSHVTNPSLFAKLPYDSVKSFEPVALVSVVSLVLVVPKNSPATHLDSLIAYAKANPSKLNFGSVGAGSLGHLGAELFNTMTNTSMTHIPYKGSPQVMTALISGEIHMYFVASASSALPQIQSNQIKALGVSGKDRLPILPDTPAVNDVVRGFEVLGWNGILAPSGTPKSIVEKLNTLINQVVSSSEFQQKLRAEGARSSSITAAEFGLLIQKDIQKWAGVIKKAGITPE